MYVCVCVCVGGCMFINVLQQLTCVCVFVCVYNLFFFVLFVIYAFFKQFSWFALTLFYLLAYLCCLICPFFVCFLFLFCLRYRFVCLQRSNRTLTGMQGIGDSAESVAIGNMLEFNVDAFNAFNCTTFYNLLYDFIYFPFSNTLLSMPHPRTHRVQSTFETVALVMYI